MKNKEKSTLWAVLLIGVLLIIGVYLFVYKSYSDKTNELKSSNSTLQTRVNELKVYYDDKETYENGIKEFTKDIQTKLGVFPGDNREEDALALAVETWNQGVLVDYRSISVTEPEEVSSIDADTVKSSGLEGYEDAITFNQRLATYANVTDYTGLKDIVRIFNNQGDRMIISTISYNREEDTGLLSGNIETTSYYVTGIGAPYNRPEFGEYATGLTNIFATVTGNSDKETTFISNGQIINMGNNTTAPADTENVDEVNE